MTDPRRLQGRRKLDLDDYRLMGLPRELHGARLLDVPPAIAEGVQGYLMQICELVNDGRGFLLSGPIESGKSLTAAVVAKEAMRRGFSVYWTRVSDLRRDIKNRRVLPINDGTLPLERSYEVGLLVLDDLRAEDARDFNLSVRDIEDIVTGRGQRGLASIVTTRLDAEKLKRTFPDFVASTRRYLRCLMLGGDHVVAEAPVAEAVEPLVLERTTRGLTYVDPDSLDDD